MKIVSKMDKAKTAIVLDFPFFASILLRHPLEETESIPTLAVTNRGRILYNPKFVETLTVQQLVWALCHEVMHVVCQHAVRLHDRNHKKWNYAGDAYINDLLNDCGIGQKIDGTVEMPGSKDKTTDEIYNALPDQPPGRGKGKGKGDGSGGDYMDGDGMGDDLVEEGGPLTASEQSEQEARTRIEVAEAAQAAKMKGKLSGTLAKFVADFIEVKTPWYEILERHLVALTRGEYSWARPERRYGAAGYYLPSTGKVPQMGTAVVVIDVSGSISRQELKYYNGHLDRIHKLCRPEKLHVIYVDTDVKKHLEFNPDDDVMLEYYSGGGTHMPAAFDWAEKEGIEPEVMVFLTDGYTNFGQSPNYPVVWCISSQVNAPWGETIHFSMND